MAPISPSSSNSSGNNDSGFQWWTTQPISSRGNSWISEHTELRNPVADRQTFISQGRPLYSNQGHQTEPVSFWQGTKNLFNWGTTQATNLLDFSLDIASGGANFLNTKSDKVLDVMSEVGGWSLRNELLPKPGSFEDTALNFTLNASGPTEQFGNTYSLTPSFIGRLGSAVDAATGLLSTFEALHNERETGSVLYPETMKATWTTLAKSSAAYAGGSLAATGTLAVAGLLGAGLFATGVATIAVGTAAAVGAGYATGKFLEWFDSL